MGRTHGARHNRQAVETALDRTTERILTRQGHALDLCSIDPGIRPQMYIANAILRNTIRRDPAQSGTIADKRSGCHAARGHHIAFHAQCFGRCGGIDTHVAGRADEELAGRRGPQGWLGTIPDKGPVMNGFGLLPHGNTQIAGSQIAPSTGNRRRQTERLVSPAATHARSRAAGQILLAARNGADHARGQVAPSAGNRRHIAIRRVAPTCPNEGIVAGGGIRETAGHYAGNTNRLVQPAAADRRTRADRLVFKAAGNRAVFPPHNIGGTAADDAEVGFHPVPFRLCTTARNRGAHDARSRQIRFLPTNQVRAHGMRFHAQRAPVTRL